MEQAGLVAGEAPPMTVSPPSSSPTLGPSAKLPAWCPKEGSSIVQKCTRVHTHGSCLTLFLLGAFCLELESSQGPQVDRGSMEGNDRLSVSLGFRRTGSAGVSWIKAGHIER